MTDLVQLESVGVALGGQPILTDITLALAPGETTAIVGPNGSGKTTLLRLLATLIRPGRGHGQVLGSDLGGMVDRSVRNSIGLITHTPALIEELTIRENLVHFCRVSNRPETSADRALSVVGMANAADRTISRSSFGMKRRAEIAWLLVAKPRLLLLDEARSGLDVEARTLVDSLTRLTIERKGGVVTVSHEAEGLGSGLTAIHRLVNGRLELVR